jgi:hypothetical protein
MARPEREQDAILTLMQGKYEHILPIEAEWGIRFEEGDMRPRIEHFHDAVRALTSGVDVFDKASRLSVEHLAYDLSHLRQIQARPVGQVNRARDKSTGDALVALDARGKAPPRLPPQGVRQELVQHYRDYSVFFAALFAPVADRNFKAREDAIEGNLVDLSLVEEVVEALASGQMEVSTALREIDHVEQDDLRERIQKLLMSRKLSAREKQEAQALVATIGKNLKSERKRVDAAHTSYLTGQLAIYEESRDMIKKLADAGMNLAGKFLETAVRNAGQGRGRS